MKTIWLTILSSTSSIPVTELREHTLELTHQNEIPRKPKQNVNRKKPWKNNKFNVTVRKCWVICPKVIALFNCTLKYSLKKSLLSFKYSLKEIYLKINRADEKRGGGIKMERFTSLFVSVIFVIPSKFIHWIPNLQWDGIWRWGL